MHAANASLSKFLFIREAGRTEKLDFEITDEPSIGNACLAVKGEFMRVNRIDSF